ncbi:peptidoglycan DD-metalloendopeptidase family protein [Tellurirhabdus rosea]|uniref:peptidoglycan DD-metalloendopeptidase family protein n=1 Tax=Tellurirhabdus rosea TaxID=2674997 RepID=UPI00224D3DDA|nr:peptidoglycan DD-metalloendopeptidase family protein [Tellurirhabdus rosea]
MRKLAVWWLLASFVCCGTVTTVQAQERGKFKNNVRIKPKSNPNSPSAEPAPKPEEEFEQETSSLRFNSQFEPKKEVNPVVAEDTTEIDEGEVSVVEIVDSVQVGDDWVKIADYYAVWDSRSVDPYGIDPLDFDEVIDIKLYDETQNHFWSMPLTKNEITSIFGPRWGRWHKGVDLDLETGDPVYATFDGIVRVVGWDGNGFGRFVLVRHYNGLETVYGHLSKALVETGQLIKSGDQIGLGGNTGRSTGSHLHYETRYEGNPFSPMHLYDFPQNRLISDHFILTSNVWDYLRGRGGDLTGFKPKVKRTVLHKVRSGETLTSIARRYGMTASTLARKNHLSTRSRIRPGQKLRVH